ncbi:MAG: polysaccharide deacetylase family protein, partial [Cellvibrionaceae bacterium]
EVSNGRPIDREAAAAIIQAMKAYPDNQIQEWLESTQTDQTAPSTLMSWEQLKEMSASGLVEVGSHTCHHFRLTQDLPAAVIQRELEESKSRLEAGLGKSISLFCYPNGDLCDLALQTIPLHYDAAVTTQRGINREPSINPYKLLRIGVHQDRCNTAVKFCSRLADWY